jgi:Bacterial TSP3 repeat
MRNPFWMLLVWSSACQPRLDAGSRRSALTPVPRVIDVTASTFTRVDVDLTAGVATDFDTTALSTAADLVLHIFNDAGEEVARAAGGSPGVAPHLTFTAPASGTYGVLVRARTATGGGSCDLLRNGAPLWSGVAAGGAVIDMDDLVEDEVIETVRQPNGAGGGAVLWLVDPFGEGLERIGVPFMGGASLIALDFDAGDRRVFVGAQVHHLVGGLVTISQVPGAIRVVRNDVNLPSHDSDGDGLGNEVEAEIGTCSALSGIVYGKDSVDYDCSTAADARDTDGDGISDGWEFLGRNYFNDAQPLPLWGADPRHKDLFAEVDYMRRCDTERRNGTDVRMPPAQARRFTAVWNDAYESDPLLLAYHAGVLHNPDRKPGIRVHLDTGVAPATPDDATLYGDWGGFNAVDAIETTAPGNCRTDFDEDGTPHVRYWKGQKAGDVWQDQMSVARRGIFRYHLAWDTGAGQTGNGFIAEYAMDNGDAAAHETGHSNGLGHNGPYDYELVDVNCKPNYTSIMNYAFSYDHDFGFSDGLPLRGPPLNNAALTESGFTASQDKFLDALEDTFKYWVDHTTRQVDWNRDGIMAPAGTTVRAYANNRFGTGCEYTKYNKVQVAGTVLVSPAIARLGDRMYVFYISSADFRVKYRSAPSLWSCEVPAKDGCGSAAFGAEQDAGFAALTLDAAAAKITVNGGLVPGLLVVGICSTGQILSRTLTRPAGVETWSSVINVSPRAVAYHEPALAARNNGSAVLLYKNNTDHTIHVVEFGSTGWGIDRVAVNPSGVALSAPTNWVTPNAVEATLWPRPTERRLYGVFPTATNTMSFYSYDGAGIWHPELVILSQSSDFFGRPALAAVPYGTRPRDRLYMAYQLLATGNPNPLTYTAVSTIDKYGAEKLSGTWFTNSWFASYGVDYLFEPNLDTHPRLAVAISDGDDSALYVYPKPDGINDFTYNSANDWQVLRVDICAHVVNPGGTVTSPITCPPRDW